MNTGEEFLTPEIKKSRAVAMTLLETSNEDTAIIVKFHPEWEQDIRKILNKKGNKELDLLLKSAKKDKPDILSNFVKRVDYFISLDFDKLNEILQKNEE